VVTIEVVLMTGAVYHIPVRFGDMDTPFGVLSLLYVRMVACESDQEVEEQGGTTERFEYRNLTSEQKTDVLLSVFRGFVFYSWSHFYPAKQPL